MNGEEEREAVERQRAVRLFDDGDGYPFTLAKRLSRRLDIDVVAALVLLRRIRQDGYERERAAALAWDILR